MTISPKIPPTEEQALSYYRWAGLHSPSVIEFETGLADRLLAGISGRRSEREEFGGLLIGEYAKAAKPTLRIDDIVWIGHNTGANPRFELTPEERIRLSSTRRNLITPTRTVLGFFRTHARIGPLILSAADRDLLESEFRRAIHVALLVRVNRTPTAAFFVQDKHGRMQAHPAYPEFHFDSQELSRFATLVRPVGARPALNPPPFSRKPNPWLTSISQARWRLGSGSARLLNCAASIWRDLLPHRSILLPLAVSCLLFCLLFTLWAPFTASVLFRAPQLHISARGTPGMVEVHWNTRLADSPRIDSATLIVDEGNRRREIRLSSAEFQSGTAAYTPSVGRVRFSLVLSFPGSLTVTRSTDWIETAPPAPRATTASDKA